MLKFNDLSVECHSLRTSSPFFLLANILYLAILSMVIELKKFKSHEKWFLFLKHCLKIGKIRTKRLAQLAKMDWHNQPFVTSSIGNDKHNQPKWTSSFGHDQHNWPMWTSTIGQSGLAQFATLDQQNWPKQAGSFGPYCSHFQAVFQE